MDIKHVIIQCTPAVTVNIPVTDDKIFNDCIVITMDDLYNPEYGSIDSSMISEETKQVIETLGKKNEIVIKGTV